MGGPWDRDRFATLFRFTPCRSALPRKPSLSDVRSFSETCFHSFGRPVSEGFAHPSMPKDTLTFSPYPERQETSLKVGGIVRSHALRFPNSISHVAGSTRRRGLPEPCFAALS
jgi:hypothetical protein